MTVTLANRTICVQSRPTGAFSLIEMLVVISILGVLFALTLPALSHARESALLITAMQHQRQVAIGLNHYCDDNNQVFPYWGKPGTNDADLYYHGRLIFENAHWAHPYAWGMYLEDHGYDGWSSASSGTGLTFGGQDASHASLESFFTSLHYITHTVYAEPSYFDGDPGSQKISHYRVMRLTDAVHPSSKGMLWASLAQFGFRPATTRRTPYVATLCDLHTEAPDHSMLLDPIELNDGWSFPFAATRDGMLGRDLR